MEQALRKTAIERYLKGELPKSIYTDLSVNVQQKSEQN